MKKWWLIYQDIGVSLDFDVHYKLIAVLLSKARIKVVCDKLNVKVESVIHDLGRWDQLEYWCQNALGKNQQSEQWSVNLRERVAKVIGSEYLGKRKG